MRKALLRQNPHTYWGMFKCFLWYRASMVEGTHPMVTGFFRLKDRLSRAGRAGRSRAVSRSSGGASREIGHITLGYAKLLLEMQELWLATRIRREEYGWVGDLRALKTRAAAMLEVKTSWARLHAAMAARLRDLKDAAEAPAVRMSAAMHDRFEAVRQAAGRRADELARAAGSTWAELRVASVPPLRPRSALRRLGARLNVVRTPTLEARRKLSAYWTQTERRVRDWQFWRLNPFSLAWNGIRDLKNLAIFVGAMTKERVLTPDPAISPLVSLSTFSQSLSPALP